MQNNIYVWDKFIRLFHWLLVFLFTFSYLTGEEESILHIYSGYSIVTLLILRLIWGFVGSKHARFSDFICGPADVMQYIHSLLRGKPKRYLGHNPLGGVMVLAMLAALLLTTFSGLKLYAEEEGKGPLANEVNFTVVNSAYADDDDDDDEKESEDELWEEIHEFSVNLMLLLIALHIGGVIYSSRVHGESLVMAMIKGYKEDSDK